MNRKQAQKIIDQIDAVRFVASSKADLTLNIGYQSIRGKGAQSLVSNIKYIKAFAEGKTITLRGGQKLLSPAFDSINYEIKETPHECWAALLDGDAAYYATKDEAIHDMSSVVKKPKIVRMVAAEEIEYDV